MKRSAGFALLCALFLVGCAFDVISIRQLPAAIQPATETESAATWMLDQDTRVRLVQGFSTGLKKGTSWRQVGRIEQGDVLRTSDQIVAVEASNQHEAYLVVKNDIATGFYLPVEKTFTPADPPTKISFTRR